MAKQNNFKVISIRFLKDSTANHQLFVKEHSLRHQESDKPPGRTLFILNIPPFANEKCLKQLFSQFGNVVSVALQTANIESESRNGFQNGYIVFASRSALLKSLECTHLKVDTPLKTGLSKWVQDYNQSITKPEVLQNNITAFMRKYDKSETKKDKKETEEEVDDKGWTVVTKKGRNPGFARKESVEIKIKEKIKATAKKKELQNFYTFQIKQNKMKNIVQLRKNYEEAKKKVAMMKASRRFKPY